ncbi:MAG: lytic transglycosylase domain-containing protein [Bacteroidota bacterium]|nr:lytic transglycosylase domain-containing protein [Bacteroidota bacterium]
MLKRKQLRAGFFGHGLLIISTPHGAHLQQQPAEIFKSGSLETIMSNQKNIAVHSQNDTIILRAKTLDSSQLATNEILEANSPKIFLNPKGAKFVANYLEVNNEMLQKIKKRSNPYFKIIDDIFHQHGLPLELKYLAVIESKLNAKAVSHAGAVGPWQFMPTTAKELGLRITQKYDERTHYYKSTKAAAKYLKYLHQLFGDWLLVIAAYNGGPGTVYKAIRNSGSRNFWVLQHHLPAETRGHVKRFIGAHYFFEKEGGLTTLTKAETLDYIKAQTEFTTKQQLQTQIVPVPVLIDTVVTAAEIQKIILKNKKV